MTPEHASAPPAIRRVAIANALAALGGAAQIALFDLDLMASYPYKMMSYPPAEFYAGAAMAATLAGLVLVLAATIWTFKRRSLAAPLVVGVGVPVLFALFVGLGARLRYGEALPAGVRNFDGHGATYATELALNQSISLLILGALLGGFCFWLLARRKAA